MTIYRHLAPFHYLALISQYIFIQFSDWRFLAILPPIYRHSNNAAMDQAGNLRKLSC